MFFPSGTTPSHPICEVVFASALRPLKAPPQPSLGISLKGTIVTVRRVRRYQLTEYGAERRRRAKNLLREARQMFRRLRVVSELCQIRGYQLVCRFLNNVAMSLASSLRSLPPASPTCTSI